MTEDVNKLIKSPVEFVRGYIHDAEGNVIMQVRGWGRLQYLKNPEEKQDAIGRFVADAINEKLNR